MVWGRLVVPTRWLKKVKLVADRVAFELGATPMPSRATECGLPTVLSVIVIDALLGPNWLGMKVTFIAQLAAAARLDPQVLLWLKSAVLVPIRAMPLITTSAPPVLATVT